MGTRKNVGRNLSVWNLGEKGSRILSMTSHEQESGWLVGIFGEFKDETSRRRIGAAQLWHQAFIHKQMPWDIKTEKSIRFLRQMLRRELSNQDITKIVEQHKLQDSHEY